MAIALSLMVLATLALLGGGIVLLRKGLRTQAWLMLALALIMGLNIAIWTVPTQTGTSLVSGVPVQ
ncbi:hypothetical protein [Novosphingobium sp. M1R2S20]|uniref:Uncharacterized protein n=1 Tax=Novosphingobium rhizovicinum TaxID=3228928 RepID=A0ABV3RBJ3_9SPHN